MKPFSLEEYLKNPSKKVVTRDGKSVKIYCTDYIGAQHIIAKVEDYSYSISFYNDGKYCIDRGVSHLDLFFAPEKHEGWTPVYREPTGKIKFGYAYSTKKEAEETSKCDTRYLTTTKVEWEE